MNLLTRTVQFVQDIYGRNLIQSHQSQAARKPLG